MNKYKTKLSRQKPSNKNLLTKPLTTINKKIFVEKCTSPDAETSRIL